MRLLRYLVFFAVLAVIAVVALKFFYRLPEENFDEATYAAPPAWEQELGQAIRPSLEAHPGENGIRPLPTGAGAFAARIVLARQAQSSIDAQYYIWQDDTTGLMLLDELRAAAERGVRVRLLVDDNGIPGMDGLLSELDAMPNADVRIFNPFVLRDPKLAAYLFDFSRLNRRMHNKSMIFDGVATIVGGRNIGNIYFDYGEGTHYFDVDAVAIGPIVDDVAASFDDYWNSQSAYDWEAIVDVTQPTTGESIAVAAERERTSAVGIGYRKAVEESEIGRDIKKRSVAFEWGEVRLYVDDPTKGLGQATEDQIVVGHLYDIAGEAQSSLDLVSAYFIPGDRGTEFLRSLVDRGVRTRVLTNSLDATDVAPVHSGYMNYRKRLLEGGVTVLELKALREEKAKLSLPEALAGSASGLHAKVFGIDGKRIFIGSYNLDPRSAHLNTEMGLLIDSPMIAKSLARRLDEPKFAYRVELDEEGDTQWVEITDDGKTNVYESEPETSTFKRVMVTAIGWLPIEWIL